MPFIITLHLENVWITMENLIIGKKRSIQVSGKETDVTEKAENKRIVQKV